MNELSRNTDNAKDTFKQYHKLLNEIEVFYTNLSNKLVRYFEAKPVRAVGLEEMQARYASGSLNQTVK